jgi:hypothetical protein
MMRRLLAGITVLSLLYLAPSAPAQAQSSPTGKEPKAPTPLAADVAKGGDAAGKRMTLDKLKLPPGGILVLVEQAKDALDLLPKMVYLTPEKWQEIEEQLSTLKRQLKVEKKLPSVCKLTGRLDGDLVRMQADFKFTTDQPKTVVFLGCQGAVITEAKLDPGPANPEGQLPFLEPGENGYAVHVEQAGEHGLTLHLKLPVQARAATTAGGGSERGFELGLPGAAVTLLTLELPPNVKEVRWNEFVEKQRPTDGGPGPWTVAVGRVKNLNVSWREPVTVPGAGPLRTADGQITVQVEAAQVVTTAELTLEDLRGQTREWRVAVPPQAKVEVTTPAGLACEVVAPANPSAPYLVRLSEPTTERFRLVAQLRQSRPFSKLLVGPFTILDAYRQQGTITIKAAPEATRGLKLVYHRQGDVVERDVPKDAAAADVVAVFKYWNMLPPGTPAGPRSPRVTLASIPPLELELKAVKGTVETQVEHTLQLKRVQEGWLVTASTRIHAKPVHDGVDYLEVQLPRPRPEGLVVVAAVPTTFPATVPWAALPFASQPFWPVRVPREYEFEGEDGAGAAELLPPTAARKAGIKLNRFQSKKFTVLLTGTYLLPPSAQFARLELPRPLAILDRGTRVKVEVEDSLELLPGEGMPENVVPHRHELTTAWQRSPVYVDVAWRPYRPEMPIRVLADVTLREHHAHVRQEVQFPSGETGSKATSVPLPPLRVHMPATVRSLKVVGGGKLQSVDPAKEAVWITAPADARTREPVVMEFDFALPGHAAEEPGRRSAFSRHFNVPLLWPALATRAETRVRFWCDPGTMPTLAEPDLAAGPWRDQGTEVVSGRDSLPALVVFGDGLNLPLNLRVFEPTVAPLPGVVVDRALIQVAVDEEKTARYRARFLISKLSVQHLDVELPAGATSLMPEVFLDHKRVPWRLTETGGKVARLNVEPSLYARPVVLEVQYRLVRGQPDGEGLWRNSVHAPVLRGEVLLGRVRWQLTFPAGFLALVAPGDAHVEQHWAWRGWLPMPEPSTTTAELEHWLGGGDTEDPPAVPTLVCWRSSFTPLRILRVPQQLWLLGCSGLFLTLGLGISFVPSRWVVWLLVALIAPALVAAAVLWPAVAPAVVYGCQPGVLVLALVLGVQWMLQRQYRRQVVFMPGFTRLKPGSSLVRSGNVARPREASTIDAPPPSPGSNQGSGVSKGI